MSDEVKEGSPNQGGNEAIAEMIRAAEDLLVYFRQMARNAQLTGRLAKEQSTGHRIAEAISYLSGLMTAWEALAGVRWVPEHPDLQVASDVVEPVTS